METAQNIALILAGGTGSRAGFSIPKQFVTLNGRCMIEHTVNAFQQNPLITGIVIVTNVEYADKMRELAIKSAWTKLLGICNGGPNRFASGNSGLSLCPAQHCNILIHDAARPLVSQRIITQVCQALEQHSAVDVAVPSTDSLIVSDGHTVEKYLDRGTVWNVQTPQGFHVETIRRAYTEALRNSDFSATDDCSVVRKYCPDQTIALVEGDVNNIKFTYPADKETIERLLAQHNPSAE